MAPKVSLIFSLAVVAAIVIVGSQQTKAAPAHYLTAQEVRLIAFKAFATELRTF